MGVVDGVEWLGVAIYALGLIVFAFLILSAQGDRNVREERGENDNEQAAEMMIHMLRQARRSVTIHDDGNSSRRSIYNRPDVIAAFKDAVKRGVRVRCLFNDKDEPLLLLTLARSKECGQRIEIWYARGPRPKQDIHYKIIDDGKLLHLSRHRHGVDERGFVLRRPPPWAVPTHFRVSKPYRVHFKHGLATASRAAA